jgi:hypothetical protein
MKLSNAYKGIYEAQADKMADPKALKAAQDTLQEVLKAQGQAAMARN